MAILRTITLLMITLSLALGGVANASSICCHMKQEVSPANEMAMPCHDGMDHNNMANKASSHASDNCGCDCQHVLKMSALTNKATSRYVPMPRIAVNDITNVYSHTPAGDFQPPKHIS